MANKWTLWNRPHDPLISTNNSHDRTLHTRRSSRPTFFLSRATFSNLRPYLLRPILITSTITSITFFLATKPSYRQSSFPSPPTLSTSSEDDEIARVVSRIRVVQRRLSNLGFPEWTLSAYYQVHKTYHSLRLSLVDSQKTLLGVMALHLFATQFPRFVPFLAKHLSHNSQSRNLLLPLVASWTQTRVIPLMVTMVILYPVGVLVHEKVGRRKFLIFYVCAGMGGLTVAQIFRGTVWAPQAAVSACAAAVAFQYPGAAIHLPILEVPINVGIVLPALGVYDIIAIVRGSNVLSHHARLVGMGIGVVCATKWQANKEKMERNNRMKEV